MNILYLADPDSVHDIKWISYFSSKHCCYLIVRKSHIITWTEEDYLNFQNSYGIKIIGSIEDFSILRFWRTIRDGMKIIRWLQTFRINIFHIMYAEPNSLWGNFRQISNKGPKWILTTRGTDILKTIPEHFTRKNILNRLVSFLYKRAFRQFDHITCTSASQVNGIRRFLDNSPTVLIRTGVDIQNIQQDTTANLPDVLKGKKYVLFPRNMRPLYNHEFSLRAIKLLPTFIKEQYSFVFVDRNSSDSTYVKRVKCLMDQDPLSNFIFLDRQSQNSIWEMYKNSSLVIMNPNSDGSPVSAMETIVCGAPLILGNLPYDEDIFEGIAIKLSSWDPNELATKIIEVLTGPFNTMRADAINRILEKCNRISEMNKLQLLYEDVGV